MSNEQHDHKPAGAGAGANSNSAGTPEHEALYDRFTERASELFAAGQEKSREAMEKAMDAARQQFSTAGELSAEQGELFKQYMRRDLAQTEQDMRALSQESKERLHCRPLRTCWKALVQPCNRGRARRRTPYITAPETSPARAH